MAKTNANIQINKTTVPGGFKVATYQYLDSGGDLVESEAVTLTDADGNELIGPQPSAGSVPVTLATDQVVSIAQIPTYGLLVTYNDVDVATGSAVVVLAANAGRKKAILQNIGTQNVRIGDLNVTATQGLRLTPNSTVVYDQPFAPATAIYAIAETGTTTVAPQEIT